MPSVRTPRVFPAALLLVLGLPVTTSAALLKVPEGFEVRLVASVPTVQFPCQVATAPDGALYVAEDPMDQVGPYEADHGRILVFREGREPVVFADGFRAIFGMAWHDGALYVSHMPYLSVLRDTDGDGKADARRDLFRDLGITNNGIYGLNDHIVSGIQFGLDGALYISVGDKGIYRATGPDGRTLQLVGGGIVRCRPDGTGIECVSSGTRNHLEANLDDRDNLFTYDNTDDGLGWWTRLTHQIEGGYYGYPFDYHDHAERMLPRMAEYGGGAPCGGVVYKEDAWPERYRNVGLWAEWGKGKVQAFRFAPDGATFKVAEAFDFAVPGDVSHFRPVDLALSHDGRTLYIADWNLDGWGSKTARVGRVFAVTYTGHITTRPRARDSDPIEVQLQQLDHPSFHERMRAQAALVKHGRAVLGRVTAGLHHSTGSMASAPASPLAQRHLVWTLDAIAGGTPEATGPLVECLQVSPHADVRAQAARALGRRAVRDAVSPLVEALKDREPAVRLQAVIALGRIEDPGAIPALLPVLADGDVYLAFAARQALRRIGAWEAAIAGLDSGDPKVRAGVLAALELVYEPRAVAALADFATDADRPAGERARALGYLAQAHRQTRPWDGRWWSTRPAAGQPPAKVVDWEGTPLVLATIRRSLSDPAPSIRCAAVAAVQETGDRDLLPALRARFGPETTPEVRGAIARAFGTLKDREALPLLVAALRDPSVPEPVRAAALASVEAIGGDLAIETLADLLEHGNLGVARRAQVIAALGRSGTESAVAPLVAQLEHPAPVIRAAAAEALGRIGPFPGVDRPLRARLDDAAPEVRRAASVALGARAHREAIPALLKAAVADDTRYEATLALAAMPDVRALPVYLRGLADKSPDLRKASAGAIATIRDQAAPVLDQLAGRHELPPAIVPELHTIYTSLQPVRDWRVLGPFPTGATPPIAPGATIDFAAVHIGAEDRPVTWKPVRTADEHGRVDLDRTFTRHDNVTAFGYAEVHSPSARTAQMAFGSDDTLTVWLNGEQVYDFRDHRGFTPDASRAEVTLVRGTNRILIECGNDGGNWAFAVALTGSSDHTFLKSPAARAFDPESFRAFALQGTGKPEHGRALFHDRKGLACIKCHTVGREGGSVGPELSTVGAKYPRDVLITSVLDPSAQIASGYEPVVVATRDGRILTGIVKSDTPDALEIEDADARRIRIPREDIDEQRRSPVSLMPGNLAEGLSPQDFADLIAYLETLKDASPGPTGNGVGQGSTGDPGPRLRSDK